MTNATPLQPALLGNQQIEQSVSATAHRHACQPAPSPHVRRRGTAHSAPRPAAPRWEAHPAPPSAASPAWRDTRRSPPRPAPDPASQFDGMLPESSAAACTTSSSSGNERITAVHLRHTLDRVHHEAQTQHELSGAASDSLLPGAARKSGDAGCAAAEVHLPSGTAQQRSQAQCGQPERRAGHQSRQRLLGGRRHLRMQRRRIGPSSHGGGCVCCRSSFRVLRSRPPLQGFPSFQTVS